MTIDSTVPLDGASKTMVGKLVLLKLGDGSLDQGFPVVLQFGEEGHRPIVETVGRLPAALELRQAYKNWATAYRSLNQRLRLEAETVQAPNVSRREDCHAAARALADCLNAWLYADSFRPIREKLLEQLMPSEQVRVILQTEDLEVRRLPWHLWDFCDRYPKTEIALSAAVYERVEAVRATKLQVNVLAILGNSAGIDTHTDRQLLEQLPGAKVSFLVEPTRQELTQELWRQNWDILFFAGHSGSFTEGNRGQIALNRSDTLSLDQLKYALKRVVERGLQVAIFNSCDGLGLARELEDLRIPQTIVMREPVPDKVAQEFLKSFLAAFAQGEPFHLAVREAREILQGIEDEYPCATWLPVICQNPAVIPPTWEVLGGEMLTMPMTVANDPQAVNPLTVPQLPTRSIAPSTEAKLINDRYQIQRVLGQGGFGRTFLAADNYRFGDLCVLKQFAPANSSPNVLKRSRELFEREAKVLYQISHPQIPKFLAWFTEDDQLFIVEEFIDGKTYLGLLEERRQQGRTFSEAEIVQWLKDLLPVLDYLHNINIIHRDISPGNVMLPQHRSQPVLIDFGIVKEVASQIWSGQVSHMQNFPQASRVGKPGYAPPEQMQLGVCYPCSDLYALGMTALVLLTGRNPQWIFEQRFTEPQWRSQVSEGFYRILDKLIAENPRNRYPSAQSVLVALHQLTGSPIAPLPTPTPWITSSIPMPSPFSASPSVAPTPSVTPSPFASPSAFPTPSPFPQPTPISSPSYRSPLPTPSPAPAILPTLSSQFIEQCQRELVRCVGPMASYILDDILAQQPQLTPLQFIELLTAEIPDSRQASQFREKISGLLRQANPTRIPLQTDTVQQVSSASRTQSVAKPTAAGLPLTQEMVDHCRRELARQIGPMATCIVEDILAQSPHLSAQAFVQAIATEIPDSRQAEAFRKQTLDRLRS